MTPLECIFAHELDPSGVFVLVQARQILDRKKANGVVTNIGRRSVEKNYKQTQTWRVPRELGWAQHKGKERNRRQLGPLML